MLAALLIVFREVLEASLVVTVVMAATCGLAQRNRWVTVGVTGGLIGAGIVAALASGISHAFRGAGQEIVNAAILFIAVVLISWHVVWMNSQGRKLASELRATARSVAEGEKHMSILALVVGLAVMREGSEVVLMLQGLWTGSDSTASIMIGSVLGLAAGIGFGALMYLGLLALSVQRLFALTNILLVLIAAGMAARGANFLVQADLLPALGTRMWDTSFVLSDNSVPGKILGALIGYIARPSGIEVAFYVATLVTVFALIRVTHHLHFGRERKKLSPYMR
jgi:high-affinity iron transporter